MNRRDALKAAVTLGTLAIVGGVSGCGATQWLTNLQKFLPVLITVTTSIAQVIAGANGTQIDPDITRQITAITTEISKDLNLLQTLSTGISSATGPTLQKIETTLLLIQRNLQAVLSGFHIEDLGLRTIISTAVGAALTTIMAILALMPPATALVTVTAQKIGPYPHQRVLAKSTKAEDVFLAVAQEAFAQGGRTL